MSRTHRIAVIPGDGIGTEVVPEGLRVLDAAAAAFDLKLDYEHFEHSSADCYRKHGKMLPDNWFEQLRGFNAIFFGAVGWRRGTRPHLPVGQPAAVPPGLRPIREPAPGPVDARGAQPAGRT
jgi:tartrate dehydrogenase/decarboxylase / D-malate dehydrogenase